MNKEIKSVLAMKPKQKSKARVKEVVRVISTASIILLASAIMLVSCGNTANQQDEPKTIKKALVSNTIIRYEVKPGDTLSGIAAKYSDRWSADTPLALIVEAIKEKNSKVLINGYLLQSGTEIEVPVWK